MSNLRSFLSSGATNLINFCLRRNNRTFFWSCYKNDALRGWLYNFCHGNKVIIVKNNTPFYKNQHIWTDAMFLILVRSFSNLFLTRPLPKTPVH